jgi:hypothetical protein
LTLPPERLKNTYNRLHTIKICNWAFEEGKCISKIGRCRVFCAPACGFRARDHASRFSSSALRLGRGNGVGSFRGGDPGATVTLAAKQTGTERTDKTDEGGRYSFVNVLPGLYEIKVVATGIKT